MEQKTQEKTIYQKIFSIQGKLNGIVKDAKGNPTFKSQYFDINTLIATLRPVLQENNLVLIQPLEYKDKTVLTTRLIDVITGESIESSIELPNISDPQKIGGCITYYRRYSIQSLLMLEALDDDGETAVGRGKLAGRTDHEGALKRMNTVDELRLYLAKYPDEKNVLMPLLTARKLEINNSNK